MAQAKRITKDAVKEFKHNLAKVNAKVIEVSKQAGADEASKPKSVDPWETMVSGGKVIEPPFDLLTLAMLPENNTEMGPCISAMEVNIEGFGHRLVPRVELGNEDIDKSTRKLIDEEKIRLENFFNYASLDHSFIMLRRMMRTDLEATGNAYWEVLRNAKREIQGFVYLPSYQIRITKAEKDYTSIKVPTLMKQADGSFQIEKIQTWKRFRLYVQGKTIHRKNLVIVGGSGFRWYKEYGDERIYNNETGELVSPKEVKRWKDTGKPIPEGLKANEVVHFKIHSPRSIYGIPRYIGNLLAIFGDRASEETNYTTLKNNNIPSMLFLVSNGQLTEGSIERIEEFAETQIQGSANYSKFLLIEAEGDLEGEDTGQVKLEIKPLTGIQHRDALFQEYSRGNQNRIRRSWRLPPIFVGKSDDYTRATAETSRKLADEQIFAPERNEFDSWTNRKLLPDMGILYHTYKSNSPNTTDNNELVKILSGSEKTGGMTPIIARLILEDILGLELPPFQKDFPKDIPFSLTMAEAVKNQADATEPGQQVTALKRIAELTGADEDELEVVCVNCGHEHTLVGVGTPEAEVVTKLLNIRKALEKEWEKDIVDQDGREIGL